MAEQPSYKQLLIEVREMLADVDLYEIARKLTMVFDDQQFRSDTRSRDEFDAADHLDPELNKLNILFLDLKKALELFPSKDKWSHGSIRDRLQEGEKHREKRPRRRTRYVSRAEIDELLFDWETTKGESEIGE